MGNLWRSIQKMSGWRKLAIGLMLLFILATWLAVCLILASYLV